MKDPREIIVLTPEEKAYYKALFGSMFVPTRGGNFRIINAPKKKRASRDGQPSEPPVIHRDR